MRGKTARKRTETLIKKQEEMTDIRKQLSDERTRARNLTPAQQAAVEAKVALKAENEIAAQACLAEIQEVTKKHNCQLHAQPVMIPRSDGTFVLAANVLITIIEE